jgi:two-component system KDP operon response regulator KdpE
MSGEIVCGDLRIDLLRRSVTLADRDIHLTPTEYKLLHELALNPNRVLLHEQLLSAVWGTEYRDDIDYLRAYIHYLRRKLEPDPGNPRMIVSSPGVGYMLEVNEGSE